MAEAPVTPTSAPLLFGRYRVRENLGETRLAAVYAAVDERLQRRVLLHLLRKELVSQDRSRARFVAEIGQSAQRSHQALLEVFDSGEVSGRPFMVTEYVSGRALRGLGLLTLEQALLYLRQVTGAVAACQAQRSAESPAGLYHPPIASANVLLVDEGRVKLVESWLTPLADAPRELAHYRAPELSQGQPASPASAVYALGLLLYELVTGVRPVSGEDAREVALAHLNARIPPLAQARPSLYLPAAEQLLARATARLPEQRYPDAAAFGDALDALWRDLSASTQRLAVAGRGRRQPSAAAPAAAPAPEPEPVAAPAAPARPAPPVSMPRRALSELTGRLTRPSGPQGVDPDLLRRRNLTRGLIGWLVMLTLLVGAAGLGYVLVNALADQISAQPAPNLPAIPSLPTVAPSGPLDWLGSLFGSDEEIYIVNIAEGLNLRSEPDADNPANIVTVVPNGTPVRKLEGPVVEDNIPWLRVRAEVQGQTVEGWMSLNFLQLEQ